MRKNPCQACPFRKESLPGWLGESSFKPLDFLETTEHHPIPCHLEVDWDKEDGTEKAYTNPCIGNLKFLKNSMVLPRNPEYAKLRNLIRNNDPEIFSNKLEFVKHHKE